MSEELYGGEHTPPPGENGEHAPDTNRGRTGSGSDHGSHGGVAWVDVLGRLMAAAEPASEFAEYIDRQSPALLFVLTGPSGVGKDVTLERMKELGVPFHYVVTVTTRKQRPGEVNGRHYHFVSKEEYKRLLDNNLLLEHAEIYGNSYGIPRSEVVDPLRRGEDVIMKPDVQGARKMRELEPDAVFIFMAPPSMEEQARRLFYRKTEDPEELAIRLDKAQQEMHELTQFDYIVVNHSNRLDDTVRQIRAIITAEKCRVHPRRIRLAEE